MFNGCISLTSLTCLTTSIPSGAITDWLSGINTTGTLTASSDSTLADSAYLVPATWTVVGNKTAQPTITIDDTANKTYTVTATGNGTIILYKDGVQVATGTDTATYTGQKTSSPQNFTFTATAQAQNKAVSPVETYSFYASEAMSDMPTINVDTTSDPDNYIVTATGATNSTVIIYDANMTQLATGTGTATYTGQKTSSVQKDVFFIAYAQEPGCRENSNGWGGDIPAAGYGGVPMTVEVLNTQGNDGNVTIKIPFNSGSISYSKDGANWTDTTVDHAMTITIPVVAGDKVYLKGINQIGLNNGYGLGIINATVDHNVSGNIMSLIYGDNFATQTTLPMNLSGGVFKNLFSGETENRANTRLKSAANLILPATTLRNSLYCYAGMFRNCSNLTAAPALPATVLETGCYEGMFVGCTSLTAAPALPATTLAQNCYSQMFQGCTGLTSVECKALTNASNALTNWLNGINTTGTLTVPGNTQIADADWYKPAGWTLVKDYSGMPLTLKVMSASEIEDATGDDSFTDGDPWDINIMIPDTVDDSLATSLSYSTDGGSTWTTEAVDSTEQTITITTEIGGTVLLKGIANQWAASTDTGLNITGSYLIAEGNVMSLIYGDNFAGQTSFPANTDSNLSGLFSNCELYDASNLILPATTLTDWCYNLMFDSCMNLVNGPTVLPATTLAPGCYAGMFQNCASLEQAPEIMATATAGDPEQGEAALMSMFNTCETLNEVRCHIEDGTLENTWLDGCASDTAEVDPETGDTGPVTDFTLYVPTDTQINDEDWYVPTGGIISKTL
jgi:hypothetical protein